MEIEKVYRTTISYDTPDWDLDDYDIDGYVKEMRCEITEWFPGGAACFPYIVIEGTTRRSVEEAYEEIVGIIKKVKGEIK